MIVYILFTINLLFRNDHSTNEQTEEKEPSLYEKRELFLMKRKESTYSVFFGYISFLL